MNKKIIMLTALLAVGMTFAACGGSKNEQTETSAPETTVSETAESSAAESDTEEDILPEESETLDILPEDVTDDTAAEDEVQPVVPDESTSDNSLFPAVEKALAESEWPVLMEVTDEVILKEFFLLDPANENYKEMIVMQCPISAAMSEIIIINADDVSAAESDLEANFQIRITEELQ